MRPARLPTDLIGDRYQGSTVNMPALPTQL